MLPQLFQRLRHDKKKVFIKGKKLLSSQLNNQFWNESRNHNWTNTSFTLTCVLTARNRMHVSVNQCVYLL